jgi:hypothetical protein
MRVGVERFEGRGWLDWWANFRHTARQRGISLIIAAIGTDWVAPGDLISPYDNDRDGFAFP